MPFRRVTRICRTFLRRFLVAAAIALVLPALGNSCCSQAVRPLPVLTTIKAVHRLSSSQASRGYPVHLKAVVTYYDPFIDHPRRPLMMATDHTASIYVGLTGETALPLKPGVLIDIRGVSNPGEFGPNISNASVRILGKSSLPLHPPRQSVTHLLTGSEDAQFVELEGVFKAAEAVGPDVTLKLALADGEIGVTTVRQPGVDYTRFIDARVLVRGIAASLFTLHGQIFGVRLLLPDVSAITIEEPASPTPFALPVSRASTLMQYSPGRVFPRRVHLSGPVTLFWPGRTICIQDGSAPLCAQTRQTTPVAPGRRVELLGFPQNGAITPTLDEAIFQPSPTLQSRAEPALPIDADAAFSRAHDAQLVQITGLLVAHDRASQDPTIVVSSGKYTFRVILPATEESRSLLALQEGSTLSITGICSVQTDPGIFTRHDGYPIAKYFQILLRSPGDIVVLERPSWWNPEHTLRVLVGAFIIILAILCWTVFLGIRLRQQTRLVLVQATRDSLTGIWNRKAVLDFMRQEIDRATRSRQTLGIMMLDADHFKSVNDTHGHLAGDAVLKELATRIQQSIRTHDLAGRYGGEEFLVILPGCFGTELLDCAERVRLAIAQDPIPAGGVELPVTVSIGTAVLDPQRNTERDALAAADLALYEAKQAGRNRVVCGSLSQVSTFHLEPALHHQ